MVTSQTLQVCTMLELLAFCDDGLWLLVGVFFVFCGADFARRLGETQARLLLCFSARSIRGGNVRFKAFCRVHTRCEATEATNRHGRRDRLCCLCAEGMLYFNQQYDGRWTMNLEEKKAAYDALVVQKV